MTQIKPLGWGDLFELMDEAKGMARGLLSRERDASLRPTELVLTALRRQRRSDQAWEEVEWANREYFFGAIYRAMRRALIDHARLRRSQKRELVTSLAPDAFSIMLERHDVQRALQDEPEVVEVLMQALDELREEEPDWANTVDYRFLGGLTLQETADMLGVSTKTVQRNWERAKLVLYRSIREKLAADE